MCESKELIVGFVYDELTGEERRALEAHLSVCGECRAELAGLRATRSHLALWAPPEPDLGFRMISGGSSPAPALPRRMRLAPVFAFAAAAAIVLAVAAAIANIEVRYGSDGLMIRTGWANQAAAATQPPGGTPAVTDSSAVNTSAAAGDQAVFAELDRRLRYIESAFERQSPGTQLASSRTRASDAELLRQVRQMLNEAQEQQKTATARQMLQIVRDVQQQHVSDIALIQQGLDQYQGMTNAEIAHSRDTLNQFIRAAARQEK